MHFACFCFDFEMMIVTHADAEFFAVLAKSAGSADFRLTAHDGTNKTVIINYIIRYLDAKKFQRKTM